MRKPKITNKSNLKQFKATLKYDKGKFNIKLLATSEEVARIMICDIEGCPDCAIIKIIEIDSIHFI